MKCAAAIACVMLAWSWMTTSVLAEPSWHDLETMIRQQRTEIAVATGQPAAPGKVLEKQAESSQDDSKAGATPAVMKPQWKLPGSSSFTTPAKPLPAAPGSKRAAVSANEREEVQRLRQQVQELTTRVEELKKALAEKK